MVFHFPIQNGHRLSQQSAASWNTPSSKMVVMNSASIICTSDDSVSEDGTLPKPQDFLIYSAILIRFFGQKHCNIVSFWLSTFFPLRKESQSFSNIYGVYCILHESTITCMGMAQAFFCQDKLQSSTKLKGSATHLPFSCPCPENWPVFWDSYLIVLTPSHHCSDIATGGRYNSSRNTKTLGDASNFQFKSTRYNQKSELYIHSKSICFLHQIHSFFLLKNVPSSRAPPAAESWTRPALLRCPGSRRSSSTGLPEIFGDRRQFVIWPI